MTLYEHIKTCIIDRLRTAVENNELQNNNGGGVNAEVRRGIALEMIVASSLQENGFHFVRAPAQQPYDFRNISHPYYPNVNLPFLEVKKFTGNTIMCNDTLPDNGILYLLVRIPRRGTPTYCFKQGEEINGLNTPELVQEHANFREALEDLRLNYRRIGDILRVFPRPTYSLDIRAFEDDFQLLL